MNTALFSRKTGAAFSVWLLAGAALQAQLPAGSPGGVSVALTKLFGNVNAFTAQVEVQVLDASQKETLRMPMSFAELDGNIRVEINVAQIQSRELSAKQVSGLKEAGLGRIVSIIRPDKKASYLLYPAAQNYSMVPMPKEEAVTIGRKLQIEKTVLGKETVDGQLCVKQRVTVKDGQRVILEAVTWDAPGLKDFPVRIETKDKGSTSIMSFRQIQFARPDPKLFEIPANYQPSGLSIKTSPGK
jgi:hypothetical protein